MASSPVSPVSQFQNPLQGFDLKLECDDPGWPNPTALEIDYANNRVLLTRGLLADDLDFLSPVNRDRVPMPRELYLVYTVDLVSPSVRRFQMLTPGVMSLERVGMSSGRTVIAAVYSFKLLGLTEIVPV